jgi:hypothetical protein
VHQMTLLDFPFEYDADPVVGRRVRRGRKSGWR